MLQIVVQVRVIEAGQKSRPGRLVHTDYLVDQLALRHVVIPWKPACKCQPPGPVPQLLSAAAETKL
jgi:hypothetical protein